MSDRYPGGFITKNTPTTTQTSASGVWTVEQAMQATKAGNWPVNGPFYVEDVVSTWLYSGNGTSQTITNGINLAGAGGLVWLKNRTTSGYGNFLFDTVRGVTKALTSNGTNAQFTENGGVSSFNSTGFGLGNSNDAAFNQTGQRYASWTFRKQPKFFDVVTYTGNGANRTIAHNLGSVPGCIIVKATSGAGDWWVYHRSTTATQRMQLNDTFAAGSSTMWNNTEPTSTVFSLGTSAAGNDSGVSYVAYLFAHNAGGFGLTGTDNVISCGSFTSTGSALSASLGYEPQWLLFKPSSGAGDWNLVDNMRGFQVDRSGATVGLQPNTSAAEAALGLVGPTATGFTFDDGGSGVTFIYIAIRRGPMKVPTDGTKVFDDIAATNTAGTPRTVGFPSDFVLAKARDQVTGFAIQDRLRGALTPNAPGTTVPTLVTSSTAAESSSTGIVYDVDNTQAWDGTYLGANPAIFYHLGRAPGFFDEVCYTGTGVARTVPHNLAAVPELMIVKRRASISGWRTYAAPIGNTLSLNLNTNAAPFAESNWNDTTPTSAVFSLGTNSNVNASGGTYVWYGFATCPGVSKVGSYTGTGTTLQVNCGFTAGSRFVLIKRTDSTGDWYVWDSARGIVAGNDPYLLLNSTAAEVTTTDYVDTYSAGFEISSTAPAAINASGGTFIFLAIA